MLFHVDGTVNFAGGYAGGGSALDGGMGAASWCRLETVQQLL